MSSCLSGGGAIDIIKPLSTSPAAATSSPLRSAQSSPSSALSDASNVNGGNGGALAIKKARAPRKRPNSGYNEAAALLASIYPSVFPSKKTAGRASPLAVRRHFGEASIAIAGQPDLLPPLPMLGDAGFLLRDAAPRMNGVATVASPSYIKNYFSPSPVNSPCSSTSTVNAPAVEWRHDGVFDVDDDADFDAESILDEESEGIDSIMGNLKVDNNGAGGGDTDGKNVSLMMFGIAGNVAIRNIRHALKRSDDGDAWWMSPAVPLADISMPPASTKGCCFSRSGGATTVASSVALPKKNSKKKPSGKKESGKRSAPETAETAGAEASAPAASNAGLGLKLDPEKVLAAWSDRGPMFADVGPDSPPPPTAEALASIDLSPDGGGGGGAERKASVLRYKEKRQTRLFSKKIRYQVRKVNADCRPRMKGRFVRSPSLLRQALEVEA